MFHIDTLNDEGGATISPEARRELGTFLTMRRRTRRKKETKNTSGKTKKYIIKTIVLLNWFQHEKPHQRFLG